MTEYEYIDALATLRDSAGFHAMNYIAILFAYVVAGYFAASALSNFQVVALTLLYIILCPMPGIATYEIATEYSRLAYEYQQQFRPGELPSLWDQYATQSWLIVFPATLVLSIVFMVQSRITGTRK